MAAKPLRIGYVPEHFSTPLHYAQKYFGISLSVPHIRFQNYQLTYVSKDLKQSSSPSLPEQGI